MGVQVRWASPVGSCTSSVLLVGAGASLVLLRPSAATRAAACCEGTEAAPKPARSATCPGVAPRLSLSFPKAATLRPTSAAAAAQWPPRQARCRGDSPRRLGAFRGETVVASSPLFASAAGTWGSMACTAAVCPCLAARWRGRLPKLVAWRGVAWHCG